MKILEETHPDQRDSIQFLTQLTKATYKDGQLFRFDFPPESRKLNSEFQKKQEPFSKQFDFEYFVQEFAKAKTHEGIFLAEFGVSAADRDWTYENERTVESPLALIEECRVRKSTLPASHPGNQKRPKNYHPPHPQGTRASPTESQFQSQLENASQSMLGSPSACALRAAVLSMAATNFDLSKNPDALELIQFAAAHADARAAGLLSR